MGLGTAVNSLPRCILNCASGIHDGARDWPSAGAWLTPTAKVERWHLSMVPGPLPAATDDRSQPAERWHAIDPFGAGTIMSYGDARESLPLLRPRRGLLRTTVRYSRRRRCIAPTRSVASRSRDSPWPPFRNGFRPTATGTASSTRATSSRTTPASGVIFDGDGIGGQRRPGRRQRRRRRYRRQVSPATRMNGPTPMVTALGTTATMTCPSTWTTSFPTRTCGRPWRKRSARNPAIRSRRPTWQH